MAGPLTQAAQQITRAIDLKKQREVEAARAEQAQEFANRQQALRELDLLRTLNTSADTKNRIARESGILESLNFPTTQPRATGIPDERFAKPFQAPDISNRPQVNRSPLAKSPLEITGNPAIDEGLQTDRSIQLGQGFRAFKAGDEAFNEFTPQAVASNIVRQNAIRSFNKENPISSDERTNLIRSGAESAREKAIQAERQRLEVEEAFQGLPQREELPELVIDEPLELFQDKEPSLKDIAAFQEQEREFQSQQKLISALENIRASSPDPDDEDQTFSGATVDQFIDVVIPLVELTGGIPADVMKFLAPANPSIEDNIKLKIAEERLKGIELTNEGRQTDNANKLLRNAKMREEAADRAKRLANPEDIALLDRKELRQEIESVRTTLAMMSSKGFPVIDPLTGEPSLVKLNVSDEEKIVQQKLLSTLLRRQQQLTLTEQGVEDTKTEFKEIQQSRDFDEALTKFMQVLKADGKITDEQLNDPVFREAMRTDPGTQTRINFFLQKNNARR
jgi:hypothetical protein